VFGQRKRNGGIPQPSSLRVCLCVNGRDLNHFNSARPRAFTSSAAKQPPSDQFVEAPLIMIKNKASKSPRMRRGQRQNKTPGSRSLRGRGTPLDCLIKGNVNRIGEHLSPSGPVRLRQDQHVGVWQALVLLRGRSRSCRMVAGEALTPSARPFRYTRPDLAPLSTRTGIVRTLATLLV
jgi:hypothetical protein